MVEEKCPLKRECLVQEVFSNLILSLSKEEKPIKEFSVTHTWLSEKYCNSKDYILCRAYRPSAYKSR